MGGLRERQYQLSAQKRNEACRKFDYYRRTARYFERECEIAKHFDAWTTKDPKPEQVQINSQDNTKGLQSRRNKLRQLISSEEELYGRQLEEVNAKKMQEKDKDSRPRETVKEGLTEKQQAEQSSFYPNYRHYRAFASQDLSYGDRPGSFQQGLKKSLEDTNMRSSVPFNPPDSDGRSSSSSASTNADHALEKEADVIDDGAHYGETEREFRGDAAITRAVGYDGKSMTVAKAKASQPRVSNEELGEEAERHRQTFETERSFPWMFEDRWKQHRSKIDSRYLTHCDIKHQMEELEAKEVRACSTRKWDEALRLRDMRNRLELLREGDLYNAQNLKMDEETRRSELAKIETRMRQLEDREHACASSSMYSEEAELLWKKWVKEDEQSAIKVSDAKREILLKDLEEEWQTVVLDDRKHSHPDPEKMPKSMQDEHLVSAGARTSLPRDGIPYTAKEADCCWPWAPPNQGR